MNKATRQEAQNNLQNSNIEDIIESINDNDNLSISTSNSDDISNLINTIFLNNDDNDHASGLNHFANTSLYNTKCDLLNNEITIQNSENVKVGDITIFEEKVNKNNIKTKKNAENNNDKFVGRITWLAQNPLMKIHCETVNEPVQLVIICDTGTDSAKTQSENKYIIRYIQCNHIEAQRWNDIGYNFLIGEDGYIYEGRGWGVVGKHTDMYNQNSVGIAFVGTYQKELPPPESLEALNILIESGIHKNFISPKYLLECQNNLMPSKYQKNKLIEILRTWKYFTESTK